MNKKYTNVVVRTNNQAEKLAALYHFAAVFDKMIENKTYNDTFANKWIKEFPIVSVMGGVVNARSKALDNELVFEFKDLAKITVDVLEKENHKFILKLGDKVKINNSIFTVIRVESLFGLLCDNIYQAFHRAESLESLSEMLNKDGFIKVN